MRPTLRHLTLLLAGLPLLAQAPPREAPPWGAGFVLGQDQGPADRPYGSVQGVEVTWSFLRQHWVQGRLRGTVLDVAKGPGTLPALGQPPLSARFLVASCDWIFRLEKAHGPYFLLGAGLNGHQVRRDWPGLADQSSGVNVAVSAGVGFLAVNRWEVELRYDTLVVDMASIWGPSRDAKPLVLAARMRY